MYDVRKFSIINSYVKRNQNVRYVCAKSEIEFINLFENLLNKKVNKRFVFDGNPNLFSGSIRDNRIELQTVYQIEKKDTIPLFCVVGNIKSKSNNQFEIDMFYDLQNGAKLYLAFLILPLSIIIFSICNSVYLYSLMGILAYLLLDLIYFLYSLRTLKMAKIYIEEHLKLKNVLLKN